MTPELSVYLNLLRVFGALEVFVSHFCIWNISCGPFGPLAWFGSDGVVMFFVLSGYVIAFTAHQKDRTLRSYFINRCARIYSVVLPALLLTLALEWIGIRWFPNAYDSVYDHYQIAKLGFYLPLWLTFSSEFWSLNEPILTNGPFWSLCFEVWFYIFFAIFLFARGSLRIIMIGAVALLVGPKICVLFPLWGLGVLAYQAQRSLTLRPWPARVLLLLSIAAYPLIKAYGVDSMAIEGTNALLNDWPRLHLQMAWQLPGYSLIALCVAGSILGMRFASLTQTVRIAYPVGVIASFTFTIYLTHAPLMKFFVTIGSASLQSVLWPVIATLVSVVMIGMCTERRIKPWRSAFAAIVQFSDRLATRAVLAARGG
jgi:peptidoglycan/LPS O-acetylase OafA/YrhL